MKRLQQRWDNEARAFAQLREDLRAASIRQPSLAAGFAHLLGMLAAVVLIVVALPAGGLFR